MKRRTPIILILCTFSATLMFLAGCVSPMGMTASTTPLEGKKTEIIGKAGGCSNWAGAVFGLWSVNRADINRAIDAALTLETDVVLTRPEDGKELVMKKGAVLRADNAALADSGPAAIVAPDKKARRHVLAPQAQVTLREGRLFLSEGGRETEIASGEVIVSGRGLELLYAPDAPSGRRYMRIVSGDMLVYVAGTPRRPGEGQTLELAEGFALTRVTGDALINVRWYERTYFFVLFSLHRVYVQGDVARFMKEDPAVRADPSAAEEPSPRRGRGGVRR